MTFSLIEDTKNHIFSVRELNMAAKQLLENGLPLLWVRGEISNFVCATSRHWYFSLKDEQTQVRCVMFRHKSQYLDWLPKNGMQVEVLALATLYEARGEFQLTLEQMRPAGLGVLYDAFERLKRKLEAEGLFDAARKRPLPFFPAQIGIITSPQAAALRDVLITLAKRMPSISVVLYPTLVQGEGAAQKIAQAIQLANERAECDVLMLCRGGGSIEDLWAFNEEIVVRAIFASRILVVSGIGHETDFTIADFVVDQRAATPTAAAQLVVPERQELLQRMFHFSQRLARGKQRQFERVMQQLDYLQRRLVHPAQRVQQQTQHLDNLQRRLQNVLVNILERQQWHYQSMQRRLRAVRPNIEQLGALQTTLARDLLEVMRHTLERYDTRLDSLQQHLDHLDPQQVLARGYSMVRDVHGAIIMDSTDLPVGVRLDIAFAHSWAHVELLEKGEGYINTNKCVNEK
ncbi:exodeoxyribonuclease VII large subunit [Candidatus Nitrotoga sp. M5]|uniref:exodeoxyribonuclease VII large subunit n=1 Tax=Candidatus Nitrotoga sp. M5 TaxID=2890409 RepID=UPI001EF54AD2|nr:exodeoxyribonuclease VII large subunit [Candidatus Nitrotoga sp. M5]CAH1388274.1 Exodeoxyribonuclease 7 large subunit [Candidatus Nitrotoga sp. M5]